MSTELKQVGHFAVITLNSPEVLNALSFSVVREIDSALDEVAAGDCRGLIFIGAGDRAFCAGADISELLGRSMMSHRADMERGQRTFDRIADLAVPSLAIINGFALGGGLELAMACDFRLATRSARMGLPEIRLGVIPGYGGTQRLPRLIGEGRALELVLSGRTVDAEEAERIGLVNRIISGDPLESGMAWFSGITRHGLAAVALGRAAVRRALDQPVSEGLRVEADLNTLAFQTADAVEGLTAFLEKRPPRFSDQ